MYLLYNILIILLTPIWLFIIARRQKGWSRIRERVGMLPKRDNEPIWIHGVSLGEVKLAIRLAYKLINNGYTVFLTSATRAGLEQLEKEKFPFSAFPIDSILYQILAVRRVRPKAVIFLETEIWPSLLRALSKKEIPTFIVNGRISTKKLSKYLLFRSFFKNSLGSSWISASSEEYADRFRSLGIQKDRVEVSSNLKFDIAAPKENKKVSDVSTLSEFMPPDNGSLWIGGSIREGEEEILLDAHVAVKNEIGSSRLIIAPRHLERVGKILEGCWSRGLKPKLRSELPGRDWDVLILDSYGELHETYGLAKVAFMGGSILQLGGQNPLEPAGWGMPVIFGPHMENFADESKALLDNGGAAQISNPEEIAPTIIALFKDESKRQVMGYNNLKYMNNVSGGIDRTVEWIIEKL